jgi:hypothetical protein
MGRGGGCDVLIWDFWGGGRGGDILRFDWGGFWYIPTVIFGCVVVFLDTHLSESAAAWIATSRLVVFRSGCFGSILLLFFFYYS